MKRTKWSDGIIKIENKFYQKTYAMPPTDWSAVCPYCSYDNIVHPDHCDKLISCDACTKVFWVEMNLLKI